MVEYTSLTTLPRFRHNVQLIHVLYLAEQVVYTYSAIQQALVFSNSLQKKIDFFFMNIGLYWYIRILRYIFTFLKLFYNRCCNWCALWKQRRSRLHIQWQTNENGVHVLTENPRFSVRIWSSRIRFLYFEDSKRFGWQHIQWYLSVSAFIRYMFIQRITLRHTCCKYLDTLYLRDFLMFAIVFIGGMGLWISQLLPDCKCI